MSIKEQVEDAVFLAEHGRHLGALTILLLAVAASSRKVFPEGVNSLIYPNHKMRDWEAFETFLAKRIKDVLFNDRGPYVTTKSGISVGFRNTQHDLTEILYKYYRCKLVHEGELPEDIEFGPLGAADNEGVSLSITENNTLIINYGLIDLLIKVVVEAPCNGGIFNIDHYDMVARKDVDEKASLELIAEKYNINMDKIDYLKSAIGELTPEYIAVADDAQLSACIKDNLLGGKFLKKSQLGLDFHYPIANFSTKNLFPQGISIIRDVAKLYEIKKI